MRRTGIKRRPPTVPQSDPSLFEIVTAAGDAYLWPIKHMEEVKEWQPTVIAWAFLGDPATKWWHCTSAQKSQPGFFDVVILQPTRGFGCLAELKVRDRQGVANPLSTYQQDYLYAAVHSNIDARAWTWPDDAREAFETLTGQPYDDWLSGRIHIRGLAS